MSLYFNNTDLDAIYFNGTKLDKVYFNSTLVYESTVYIDKPTVAGDYTFDNANKSAVISGYNSSQMTQGGTTTAKSSGTYTVTFEPKTGFAWKDGTISKVSYTWKINKRTIAIPSLSTTSFTWIEGNKHTPSVNNFTSAYVNQSGTTSQTDSSSNIGTSNTVTWSLKYASDTTWSDGTTANKSGKWSVTWSNGTSHYKNDLYNQGWNSGLLSKENADYVDMGSASVPYIKLYTWTASTKKGKVYTTNSMLGKTIHAIVRIGASHGVTSKNSTVKMTVPYTKTVGSSSLPYTNTVATTQSTSWTEISASVTSISNATTCAYQVKWEYSNSSSSGNYQYQDVNIQRIWYT